MSQRPHAQPFDDPKTGVEESGLSERLESLGSLQRGWDGYRAEPPSSAAIRSARKILEALFDFGVVPERIVPSTEGGVALILSISPYYAAIECFNDGEVVASRSDRTERHSAWETGTGVDELRATLERLRAPFDA